MLYFRLIILLNYFRVTIMYSRHVIWCCRQCRRVVTYSKTTSCLNVNPCYLVLCSGDWRAVSDKYEINGIFTCSQIKLIWMYLNLFIWFPHEDVYSKCSSCNFWLNDAVVWCRLPIVVLKVMKSDRRIEWRKETTI